MAAVLVVAVLTVGLAVLLGALLPGAGLIASVLVVVLGLGVIVWLVVAGSSGRSTSEIVQETERQELLGPGGPDDPNRNPKAA